MEDNTTPTAPAPAPMWSSIVKKSQPPPPKPSPETPSSTGGVFVVDNSNSNSNSTTKGIAVAVVDANALIEGGDKLTRSCAADKLVTVPEVMAEVRDPASRHRLSFLLPSSLHSMDPSPDSLNKVIKFARATGDLQTLSDVDLKLIALTYTLEAQIHGTKHIRECPPPVHVVNAKRLPEKELPGWGSNVPNLGEWEALERASLGDGDGGMSNSNSRILPLQDLNLNVVDDKESEVGSENQEGEVEGGGVSGVRPRRFLPKKKEVTIEGKKMVASGVDASQGEFDEDAGDWMPAVSRSTHRRFLRRKARREHYEAMAEKDAQEDAEKNRDSNVVEDGRSLENEMKEGENGDESLSTILEQMRLEEEEEDTSNELDISSERLGSSNPELAGASFESNEAEVDGEDEVDMVNEGLDHVEMSSQADESVDASYADDGSSEQSWMLRSLSESSVACVTSDFAMQNVLLQMGLRLLAPGGMQIRQLHRWILKCHACYTVTAEIGRIFCPKCGNGGTLRKVAVTVGENGVVLADRRPRIRLRGTKFSLPLPQGGREAITKNLILREDQLPQKFLHPKTKKKMNKQGDDIYTADDFGRHVDKRAPLQPPVRKALAVFSGKRNPNDNHFSRSKH
ncbi:RNA-binding NOB1-like protein [Castanea sativa]|uniref:RNA-binding NOB1-like protein n=1 Tax=Castanea sativa TaxID=21020 RepID=UPI003F64FB78